MREIYGQLKGDQVIFDEVVLHGQIAGDAVVESDGVLIVYGQVCGDIRVKAGGTVEVSGMVTGTISKDEGANVVVHPGAMIEPEERSAFTRSFRAYNSTISYTGGAHR